MRAEGIKHAEDCKCRDCKRIRNEPARETCDCCGRKRMCVQVTSYSTEPKTYDPHYCVAECLKLTHTERQARHTEALEARRRKRDESPPLAWPIIGGPLDGKFAVPADFYAPSSYSQRKEGRYHEHAREYVEFNAASGGNRRIGGFPTMIFVHRPLCKGMIRGRDR